MSNGAPVEIVRASALDARSIAGLHRRALGQPWPADDIALLVSGPGGHGWIALCAGCPVGHALARRAADEAEILAIGSRPAARRRGVARALLNRAIGDLANLGARRIYLEVAVDNAPALALYRACGFARVGKRTDYYRRGSGAIDAVILRAET